MCGMSGLVRQLADIRPVRIRHVSMIEGSVVGKLSPLHRWRSEMNGHGTVVPDDQQKQTA